MEELTSKSAAEAARLRDPYPRPSRTQFDAGQEVALRDLLDSPHRARSRFRVATWANPLERGAHQAAADALARMQVERSLDYGEEAEEPLRPLADRTSWEELRKKPDQGSSLAAYSQSTVAKLLGLIGNNQMTLLDIASNINFA